MLDYLLKGFAPFLPVLGQGQSAALVLFALTIGVLIIAAFLADAVHLQRTRPR